MSKKPPGDYEVGRGRPPKHTRFQPGHSGNPGGRKPGSKSLKAALQVQLSRTIVARAPDGKSRRITHFEGIVETLLGEVYKKNLAAIRLLFEFMKVSGLVEVAGDDKPRLTSDQAKMLDDMLAALGVEPGPAGGEDGGSSGSAAPA